MPRKPIARNGGGKKTGGSSSSKAHRGRHQRIRKNGRKDSIESKMDLEGKSPKRNPEERERTTKEKTTGGENGLGAVGVRKGGLHKEMISCIKKKREESPI